MTIEVGLALYSHCTERPQMEKVGDETLHTVLLNPGQALDSKTMAAFATLRKMSKGLPDWIVDQSDVAL